MSALKSKKSKSARSGRTARAVSQTSSMGNEDNLNLLASIATTRYLNNYPGLWAQEDQLKNYREGLRETEEILALKRSELQGYRQPSKEKYIEKLEKSAESYRTAIRNTEAEILRIKQERDSQSGGKKKSRRKNIKPIKKSAGKSLKK